MKKLFAILVLVSVSFAVRAADDINYVIVGNKTFFSNHVKIGLSNVRIETEDGLTIKAPLKKVDAYMVDGKLCERLPIYCKNGTIKCTALLELVSLRNGLKLFKMQVDRENKFFGCCFDDNNNQTMIYFVYKDGELYLRVDEKNAETVFDFFHVPFLSTI